MVRRKRSGTCRSRRQIKIVYWDFQFGGDYLKAASFVFFLRLALAQKPQDWRRWPLDTPRTLDTFREGFHFWPTRTGSELGQAWTLRAESLAPKFARIRIGIGIHIGVSPGRRYTYLNLLKGTVVMVVGWSVLFDFSATPQPLSTYVKPGEMEDPRLILPISPGRRNLLIWLNSVGFSCVENWQP